MRRLLIVAATVLPALPIPASAQLNNLIEVCGSATADARDVVQFCQRALDTGQLDRRAAAQVRANMGVGFFELGQYQSAIDAYSRAIQDEPAMIAAYLNRARAYERLGQLRAAVDDYDAALGIDPRSADAFLGRGAMLLNNGDPKRAIADLGMAIRIRPDWIAPYFNRGVAYLRLGAHAQAERDFSTVIERNAQDAGAHLNRGRARAALGLATATADFDRAVALAPEWGGAWFGRGQFRDSQGQVEAANGDFLRAYELGYSDPWLVQRVQQISR